MNSTEVKECFRKAFEEANYLLWNEAFFKFVKANYDLPIKQNNSLYRFAAMELNKELDGNRKDYFTEDSFKEMICYDIVEEGDDKMKRFLVNVFFAVLFAGTIIPLWAQEPTAAEILKRVDDNEVYGAIKYEGEMVIEYQNRRYVKSMNAWGRENSDSFIEFTNPEDQGTKYLKRGGRLYVYSPDNEEVMLISGHMLKESMMGSDLSYEDTVNNETLSARYTPELIGTETWNGREAWVLELRAKKKTESYPRQKLWVDTENNDGV